MKLRWKILIGLAAVTGVTALWFTIAHYGAKNRVAAYRRKLISQGEKLSIGELIPKPAKQDDNGASELLAAGIQLGITSSNYLPMATAMASGHSRVSWQQDALPTEDVPDLWPGLNAELDSKKESLSAARKALESPTLSFPIAYEQGLTALLPHLVTVKKAELSLAFDSVANLHKGNIPESRADLLACVTLVQHFAKDEPLEISQLVRIASGNIAASATWEALLSSSWKEEELLELQKAWDSFTFLNNLENTLAMERAFGQQAFDAARGSFSTVQAYSVGVATTGQGSLDELTELGKGLVEDPVGGFKAIFDRYPKYWAWKGWWSYEEELCWLEMHQLAIDTVREARNREGMVISTAELRSKLDNLFKSHPHAEKRFLLGIGDSSLINFLAKMNNAETVRRLIVTDIALKRFRLKTESYPNDLKQLVPQYLTSVPIDPMDGKPLRYRLNPDGTFLLYATGENGVDDNGDSSEIRITPAPQKQKRFTVWYRRRDAVWPQPATSEEIKAYHEVIDTDRTEHHKGLRNINPPAQTTNVAANLLQTLQQYGVTNPIPAKTN